MKNKEFEGKESFDINVGDIYPNATVKISKVQHSIFELKRKYEDVKRQDIVPDPDLGF